MTKRANTFPGRLFSLYISLDGRIRRSDYWLGGIALNLVQVVLVLLLTAPFGFASQEAKGVALIMKCLFFWPGFALMVKRGHDRGRPAWVAFAYVAAIFAIGFFSEPVKILYGEVGLGIMTAPVLLMGLFLLVDYGFMDGDPGRNRYGLSPKNPDSGRPLAFDDDALPGGNANA